MAIAALTMAIQNGVVVSFAVLYLPLVQEFGASRADVAAIQSAVLLLGGFGGPGIGYALDRFGPPASFKAGRCWRRWGSSWRPRAGVCPPSFSPMAS